MATLAYFLAPDTAVDRDGRAGTDASHARRAARDGAWLARIMEGDEAALRSLYLAYYTGLHSFAKSVVHGADVGEEAVHDVFLSLWERRAVLDVRDVRAYLFRAVRLRAIDLVRTSAAIERADREAVARDVLHAANAITAEHEATDQGALAAEIREAVTSAIATMPAVRATAARLRWVDGLTIAEVAQVMAISVPAAQMHVSRAKGAMAAVLERFLDL